MTIEVNMQVANGYNSIIMVDSLLVILYQLRWLYLLFVSRIVAIDN